VTQAYTRPEPLRDDHVLDAFECRSSEQTLWLRRYARQSVAVGTTRVFVVTEVNSSAVVAYYGWCMAQLHTSDAPPRLSKGGGRYPQPVGPPRPPRRGPPSRGPRTRRRHAPRRVLATPALSKDIGCRALLIHAESSDAREYYRHLVPELEDSPTDPLHLVLLMKDIRRTLTR